MAAEKNQAMNALRHTAASQQPPNEIGHGFRGYLQKDDVFGTAGEPTLGREEKSDPYLRSTTALHLSVEAGEGQEHDREVELTHEDELIRNFILSIREACSPKA